MQRLVQPRTTLRPMKSADAPGQAPTRDTITVPTFWHHQEGDALIQADDPRMVAGGIQTYCVTVPAT